MLITPLNNKDLAISIGGDTFGGLATFSREKLGLTFSEASLWYEEYQKHVPFQGKHGPDGINEIISLPIKALATSPAEFVNTWFFFFILIPFFATYFLSRKIIGKTKYSVLLSLTLAINISLSPYYLLHFLAGHFSFFLIFLILWLFAFYWLYERQDNISSILLGIAFGITTITNQYFGYFGILLYFFSIFYIYFFERKTFKSFTSKLLISWVISGIIIISVFYPVLSKVIYAHQEPEGTVFNRPSSSLWGVPPWMYFFPSPQNIFSSDWYVDFYRKAMLLGNIPENCVYLGVFNILFFGYGIYLFAKRKLDPKSHSWFRFLMGASAFCFILSLPPRIPLPNGEKIYLLNSLLHNIFPMFRVYNRIGLFVFIFVSIGGVIGFYFFLKNFQKREKIIASLAILLIFIDFTPTLPTLSLANYPPVYDWLKKKKEENIIIYEVPEHFTDDGRDDFQFYKFVYYQTIHGKRLFNRAKRFQSLQNQEAFTELKKRGVKYLIQHENLYEEGPVPWEYKNFLTLGPAQEKYNNGIVEQLPNWYILVEKVGNARVYKLR